MTPPKPPFKFESNRFRGATMNQYGIVHWDGHEVSPAIRGMVQREALAAGCRLIPSPDTDVGLVWTNPESK